MDQAEQENRKESWLWKKRRPEKRTGSETEEGLRGAKAQKCPGLKYSKDREAQRPEKKAWARNTGRRGRPKARDVSHSMTSRIHL